MKNLMVVLVLMVFFLSCKKDEPNNTYNLSGHLEDIVSGEPVPGVVVYLAYRTIVDWSTWETAVVEMTTDTTDEYGWFVFDYPMDQIPDDSYHSIFLCAKLLPDGYQHCVSVNYQTSHFMEDIGYHTSDDVYYTIRLIPHTYVVLLQPEIPAEWENAELSLTISNVKSNVVETHTFQIKDENAWVAVSGVKQLNCGREVYIKYVLTQGDSIKSGNLEVLCAAGDTTEYVLQLFD